jgi:hypothetical protein
MLKLKLCFQPLATKSTVHDAKRCLSAPNINVAHLLKKVSEFVDFTGLEAQGQKHQRVGCASRSAKPSMGMKRSKLEQSGV